MIEALLVDMLPAVMNRGPGGFWACAWSLDCLFFVCVCLGLCAGRSVTAGDWVVVVVVLVGV